GFHTPYYTPLCVNFNKIGFFSYFFKHLNYAVSFSAVIADHICTGRNSRHNLPAEFIYLRKNKEVNMTDSETCRQHILSEDYRDFIGNHVRTPFFESIMREGQCEQDAGFDYK